MRLKNRLTTIGILFGAILMALAACGGENDRLQTQDATVTVREIVNRVEVNGLHPVTKESAFIDLQLGQFLFTGNLVKTHENSSARVDISIQNFTRVSRTGPKTIWRLGRFSLDGEAVIELREGKIFVFDAGDGQEHWPLHIETPAGTASARGTWMAVEFDPETGTAQVECFRGICELENDLGYQVFTNEQVVVATKVTVPADPMPMDELQIEAFEALPEVVTEELPIPVQFTPVEVQVKLDNARTAAVERKALREERKINAALASADGNGPGNNIPLAAANPANQGAVDSEPQASANRNSGQLGGNAQARARDEESRGPDVASANANSGPSGGDIQGRARNDEAPGPRDGDAALQASANLNSGRSGGDFQDRARREEAPGPRDAEAALRASANLNSGRSGGNEQDKTVNVSNKPDDKAGSAEPAKVISLNQLFKRLGFSKGEVTTLLDQGQSNQIIAAIAEEVGKQTAMKAAKEVSKANKSPNGRAFDEEPQEILLDSAAIVSLWIDAVISGSADPSSSDGDGSGSADTSSADEDGSGSADNSGSGSSTTDSSSGSGSSTTDSSSDDSYTPPANTVPVAVNDTASTQKDVKVNINVLQNDSDADGDSMTVTILTQPSNGSVTLKSDNTVDYTPNSGFTGVDSFTYKANDGTGGSNTASVTVTVTAAAPVNALPVAVNDAASAEKNASNTNFNVLQNDSDADGDSMTVTNLTQPSNGSVTLKSDNTVDYTPNSEFTGVDSFTYTANDGTGDSNTATVTVTVTYTPPNTVAVAVNDTASTDKDVGVTIDVLANDTDVDSNTLSVTNLTQPTNGTTAVSGTSVLYTPNSGWTGVDMFTYTANDGTGDSNTATVTVTVAEPDSTVPVAVDDTAATIENVNQINISVLANDTDPNGDSLVVTNLTQPSNGSVLLKANNTVDYTPDAGFTGVDTFTYRANDGTDDSNVATVAVTVNAVPVAVDDSASTFKDVVVTIDVLANDTDGEGDTLTIYNVWQPAHGTATITAGNKVDYAPDSGWTGVDTFNYRATDGKDQSSAATVTITVADTVPVAVADTASTVTDVGVNINVLSNDTDANGDALVVTNLTQPSNGTTSVNGDNTVLYTPGSGYTGTDTFTYTANDGTDDSNTATVTVTVTAVGNAVPVAVNDTAAGAKDANQININVLANDTDGDGDPLDVTNLTQPLNGSVLLKMNDTVDYTPNSGFIGVDTFTYTANDGSDDSNVATVTVTVNAPPVAVDDSDSTSVDVAVTIDVLVNDTDEEGDTLTVSQVWQSNKGTVVINGDNTVTFTPDSGWTGTTTFKYKATDGKHTSNQATVTVTVS